MTTTDPRPINRKAVADVRRLIMDMRIGLQRLSDWLDDHPACAELPPHSFMSLGARQLVFCATPDEFTARLIDLSDGAPVGSITHPEDDDDYVTVRRSFGGGVVCDVFTDRQDGEVAS